INTTWYLHSHFVWLRLSISSIVKLLFVCLAAHVWEFPRWTPGSVKLLLPPRQSRGVSLRTRRRCYGFQIYSQDLHRPAGRSLLRSWSCRRSTGRRGRSESHDRRSQTRRDGKPADPKDFITPIVINNNLIYVAGQGAHDPGPAGQFEIGKHTAIVMDKVKRLVEIGGGTVDSILQLTVFLADIKYYDGMNQVFKTYF